MANGPTQSESVKEPVWRANRALSISLRVAVFFIPLAAGWLAVRAASEFLFRPGGWFGVVIWAVQAIAVGTAVATGVDRWSRKLLPLATLYGMSLVFPDEAPSRFTTALRMGSASKLKAKVIELAAEPAESQSAQEAAEQALVLVSMLSNHDRLTRGHSERVRAYVDLISEEMELPEMSRAKLSWAALLHDVGKLTVPAEILNAPNKPAESEWLTLKGHPARSEEFLKPLQEWLGDHFKAATEHHERWDGLGYPLGLAGTQISLAGRITAVADAYDTMTSVRSYKTAYSADSARRELVECSGGQFDPQVVRAFLNVSLGRRWTAGPFTWLAEIPGLASNSLGAVPAMVASTAVAIAVTAGAVATPPASDGPPAELAAVSQSTTTTQEATIPQTTQALNPTASTGPATTRSLPATTALTTTTKPSTTSTDAPATTTTQPRPATTSPTTAPPTTAPTTTAPPTTAPPTTAAPTSTVAPTTTEPNPVTARSDFYEVESGKGEQFKILENDDPGLYDWDEDTLRIIGGPEHAAEVRVHNDHIHYESLEGFVGADVLRYWICNTAGQCDRGTVTIRVVPN